MFNFAKTKNINLFFKKMSKPIYEQQLSSFNETNKKVIEFIKIISDLWYEKSIELVLFRNQLVDKSISDIINLHQYAEEFIGKPISINETLKLAEEIANLDLPASRIDIGKLASEYQNDNSTVQDFLNEKVGNKIESKVIEPKDVVLYGFGRIGRLLARELASKTGKGEQLRLRAVVTRDKVDPVLLEKRASLLRHDSVHGDFNGSVVVDHENNALIINGITVNMITASQPEDIDYTSYGIDKALIIDNTGVFKDDVALARHLSSKGADKVLLTAPGKNVPNIVYGVNHEEYSPNDTTIFSAASCTTNAITPILKVIEDNFQIVKGHLETIHAYTNDQNLVDNMHKKYRRGRAAALNMVITETGAGSAVAKALPSLAGKLTSNAIRVPVPNGSLVVLNLEVNKTTTKEDLNDTLKKAALDGELVEQIKYSLNNELVSSDIIGTTAPSIFDSNATIVSKDGKSIVLYVWYDNEYGYSHQVMRLAKHIAGVRRYTYY